MPTIRSLSLFTLLCAAPLIAQDKDKLCNDVQHRPMHLGQWASYAWTGGRSDGMTIRFALVGTEPVEGTPYYWYEMSMRKKDDKANTIIQMLVPGLGYQAAGVRGMIMKTGDQPAMRMPDQMVSMMGGRLGQNLAADIARKCQEMEVVGWERVTVPAGTFRALHIRHAGEHTEAWVVPDLYFGLLRATLKDGAVLELTGRGTDAKSSIAETPRSMRD